MVVEGPPAANRAALAAHRPRRHDVGVRGKRSKPGSSPAARPSVEAPPGAASPWVQLRSGTGHPFIYKRMVRAADPAARPGDVVSIYDKHGELFGRGLYNPRSEIAVRVLAFDDRPIDEGFWRATLGEAVALRRTLGLDEVTDAYRLVHAEGDGLSGLIAERYADCLVFEIFALGMMQRVDAIAGTLGSLLGPPAGLDSRSQAGATWQVVVRADDRIARLEGFDMPRARPDAPTSVVIREHDVRYRVDLATGHKTGFFCDQRENRRQFAALCNDADVLDCCCYTGGFGLSAKIQGNARDVTGVDLDEDALAVAKQNADLNQTRLKFVHADAFPWMRQMIANGRQFDRVVLDPPKLALTRNDVDDALRKYNDLNQLAVQLVRPGGILLTCSCSGLVSPGAFIQTVHRAGRRAGRVLQQFDYSTAAGDHPVRLNCPESAYLKAVWLRVM